VRRDLDLARADDTTEGMDAEEENGSPVPSNGHSDEQPTLEAMLAEERDRYLRLAAEFDNFRKRTEREMTEFKRRAADDVLLSMLEVVDNLDRALETSGDCTDKELLDGLTAVRAQMGVILDREGLEPIDAMDKPFDPYEMEAVMRMPSAEVAEGSVCGELQCGYRGRGYVLRPSKVIVSTGPEESKIDDIENVSKRK
jgi:molecular chaperone GrpE